MRGNERGILVKLRVRVVLSSLAINGRGPPAPLDFPSAACTLQAPFSALEHPAAYSTEITRSDSIGLTKFSSERVTNVL